MAEDQQSQFDDVIIWIGKPLFKPYALHHILKIEDTIRFFVISIILFLLFSVFGGTIYNWKSLLIFILVVIGTHIIGISFKILNYKKIKYWITKEHLYIQNGLSRSPTIIEKKKIIFINTEISGIDKKYDTATVLIDTGEIKTEDTGKHKVYHRLESIENHTEVLRYL